MTKKVWILEGYITPEHMQESLKQNEELLKQVKEKQDADAVKAVEELLEADRKKAAENPNGYWLGYQGKSDYRTFCRMAQETLRNPYLKEKNMKFRVLKADLRDPGAKYWMGNYENGEENPGVLRYLYATL